MASNDNYQRLGQAQNLSFYLRPGSSTELASDDSDCNVDQRGGTGGTAPTPSPGMNNTLPKSARETFAGMKGDDDKLLSRLENLERRLRENDANFTSTLERVVGEFVGRIQSLERIQASMLLENDLLRERVMRLEGGDAESTEGQFNGAPNHVGLFLQESRTKDGQAQTGGNHYHEKHQEGTRHKALYRNASAAFGESSLQIFSSSTGEEHPRSPESQRNSELSRASSESEEVETWVPDSETSPGSFDDISFAAGGWFSPREMRNLLRHGSVSDVHTYAGKELAKKKSIKATILTSKDSGINSSVDNGSLTSPMSIPEDAEEEIDSDDDRWGQMLAAEEAATAAALSSSAEERASAIGLHRPTNISQPSFDVANDLVELNFDVRSVLKTVGGASCTLTSLALRLGNLYGFFQAPGVICGIETFTLFMEAVTSGYISSNPYHNSLHAADVMLTANSYLEHSGVPSMCDNSERALDWQHLRFSLIVASVVHDLEHPARMNPFMIATKHPLSVTYASASGVLEAMHADRFLGILRKPGLNVLGQLSSDSEHQVRETILELVLATDLSKQSAILTAWNEINSTSDVKLLKVAEYTDHKLFLQIVIKAADVSNPAKPLPQYLFWTNRILEEFYSQGDEELQLGLPITSMPQCDRSKPSVAGGQKGFMMFVAKPVFEVLCDFSASVQRALPEGSHRSQGLDSCMQNLMSNLEFWKRVEAEVPAEVLEVACLPSDLPLGNILNDDLQASFQSDFPDVASVVTQPPESLPSDEVLFNLNFDVHNVAKVVGANSTLMHIAPRLAIKAELVGDKSSGALCDVATFKTFTKAVTLGYNSGNPYHNSLHAADVMLTASTYFDHCGVLELLPTTINAPPTSVASTNETIWNLKELLSKVGSVMGSSHPQPLDSKRLKIRVGKVSDALGKRVSDFAKWAAENHSQYFALNTDGSSATLSLTTVGVEYFCPKTSGANEKWASSKFALLVASMVHDLGHPARMNPFMVDTKHPLTLPYAGASGVLEAMHAARFTDILRKPGHNVLEHLAVDNEACVRESIVNLVLATDLGKQPGILADWNAKKSTATAQQSEIPIPGWNVDLNPQTADRDLFLKVVIKAADVSNPAKPLPQYLFWTNRILEEFYSQGDEELQLGLPITSMPQCDRSKPSVAGGQKGFMMFVVKPVFEVLCDFSASVQRALPEGSHRSQGLDSCMQNLMSNLEFWKRVEAEVPAEVLEVACLPSDLPLAEYMPIDSFDTATFDLTRHVIENGYASIELPPTASEDISMPQASLDVPTEATSSMEPTELDNVFKESEQRLNMSLVSGVNPMARNSSDNLLPQAAPQLEASATAKLKASSDSTALVHAPPQLPAKSDSAKQMNGSSNSSSFSTTTSEAFVLSLINKASSSDVRLSALLAAQKDRAKTSSIQSECDETQLSSSTPSTPSLAVETADSQRPNAMSSEAWGAPDMGEAMKKSDERPQGSAQENQQGDADEKAGAHTHAPLTATAVLWPQPLEAAAAVVAPKRSLFDESDSSDEETPGPLKGSEAVPAQSAIDAGGAVEGSDDDEEDDLRLTMSWL